MDKTIANAMQRRSELQRELHEIEKFLQLYQKFSAMPLPSSNVLYSATTVASVSNAYAPAPLEQMWGEGEPKQEHGVAEASPAPHKGLGREELRPHIEAVIREAGKPLTRGVLLRKLDQRGTPVGGQADRAKNMGTIMWRLKDHFVNLPGYGYWIKGEACPEADYDPELTEQDSHFDL